MILVGITGPIGHGKSTLASMLRSSNVSSIHVETGLLVAELADVLNNELQSVPQVNDFNAINDWLRILPKAVHEKLHKDVSFTSIQLTSNAVKHDPIAYEKLFEYLKALQTKPQATQNHINTENKAFYRPFLQWLGGYLVSKVGAGVWYDELIRRCVGADVELGIISGVRFPSDAALVRQANGKIMAIVRPQAKQMDLQDPTERDRDAITPDTTILNNGSLNDLEKLAAKILADVQSGNLQTEYVARP